MKNLNLFSIKIQFEELEKVIYPRNQSKHFLVQGYVYYDKKWYRYVTEQAWTSGPYYKYYDSDINVEGFSMPYLFGKIYDLDFKYINKIRYVIEMLKNPKIRQNEGYLGD